ncbi:MAG: hypothetical protein DSM106950_23835 [Stigonema ocellatum SAG 48.90 = DSM 106950]|nr:hypothetical protein [Stigonema ocellatum SAG 48.90 = DSM 106950]
MARLLRHSAFVDRFPAWKLGTHSGSYSGFQPGEAHLIVGAQGKSAPTNVPH